MSTRSFGVAALLVLSAGALHAQEAGRQAAGPSDAKKAPDRPAELMIGDPAPPLAIAKWVKGAPVAELRRGQVYMIEFWATWCGPCIASMPHISELQEKYGERGLTVIGVTSTDTRGNSLEKVEKMVEAKGKTIGYTIAWDQERSTNEAYMQASGQRGIPCSFLIDRAGKVAYIGHPAGIDATMALVMEDKHDIAQLAADYRRTKELEKKVGEIQLRLNEAINSKDWPAAYAAFDAVLELDPVQYSMAAVKRFQMQAFLAADPAGAQGYARSLEKTSLWGSAEALNGIAWTIVDPSKPFPSPDLDLALRMAERAVKLVAGEPNEGMVLDTLARVWFAKGDLQKAIDVQTRAVEKSPELKPTLDEYRAALEKKTQG